MDKSILDCGHGATHSAVFCGPTVFQQKMAETNHQSLHWRNEKRTAPALQKAGTSLKTSTCQLSKGTVLNCCTDLKKQTCFFSAPYAPHPQCQWWGVLKKASFKKSQLGIHLRTSSIWSKTFHTSLKILFACTQVKREFWRSEAEPSIGEIFLKDRGRDVWTQTREDSFTVVFSRALKI